MLSKTRYSYPLLVQPVNDFECRPHALMRESVECPDEQNVESIRRRPGICDDIRKELLVRALRCGDAILSQLRTRASPQSAAGLAVDSRWSSRWWILGARWQPSCLPQFSLWVVVENLPWPLPKPPAIQLHDVHPDIVRMDVPQGRTWVTWVVNVEVALLWS